MTTDKTGTIYLINRDQMGHFTMPSNSSRQSFGGGSKNRSSFAFFNNVAYGGFAGEPLQAWAFNPSTELFTTTPESKSGTIYWLQLQRSGHHAQRLRKRHRKRYRMGAR